MIDHATLERIRARLMARLAERQAAEHARVAAALLARKEAGK